MSKPNPPKYAALSELIRLRGDGGLVNRLTERKLIEREGQCSIRLPSGKIARFAARPMREYLATHPPAPSIGRPPDLARYKRLAPLFCEVGGALIRISTGKAPAIRKDGQCRVMLQGKAITFSPSVMLAWLNRRENITKTFEAASGPWLASLFERYGLQGPDRDWVETPE